MNKKKEASQQTNKKKSGGKRNVVGEIALVVSALILGTLIVIMVYRNHNQVRNGTEDRVITGDYPSPTEIVEKDKSTYFSYMEIPDIIFRKMDGVSFSADCPVAREDLRYMKVLYWGKDNQSHQGELIVNKDIAEDVQTIFYQLYKAFYPIESIKLVDEYGGNDEVSMAHNNTSCFNARKAAGDENSWSKHAYGMAIDLNPLYNPYVNGETVLPVDAEKYVDRSKSFAMKITENDYSFTVFNARGFTWGGNWETIKDYQHFEK